MLIRHQVLEQVLSDVDEQLVSYSVLGVRNGPTLHGGSGLGLKLEMCRSPNDDQAHAVGHHGVLHLCQGTVVGNPLLVLVVNLGSSTC